MEGTSGAHRGRRNFRPSAIAREWCRLSRALHAWTEFIATLVVVSGMLLASRVEAQDDSSDSVRVTFGGFVDSYYAFDLNRPPDRDRAFTTQAIRHNEFNVNLAYIESMIASARLRGRVAAQFGTSVQSNYAGEPTIGVVSGPDVSRFIQEAVVGYKVVPSLWLDAGIFMSSFGSESWISRDNWTYTRSLVAEYSPYYESGIKATWTRSRELSAQLHLINGWQNISESNSAKAVGVRVDFSPSSRLTIAYDAFVGNEAADSLPDARRVWHDAIVTLMPAKSVGIRATLDYGLQRGAGRSSASWWGYSVIGRYSPSSRFAVAARAERFEDDDQVVIVTGQPYGFRATGWSANIDVTPANRLLCRIEFRELTGDNPVFPGRRKLTDRNRLVVGSAALTF